MAKRRSRVRKQTGIYTPYYTNTTGTQTPVRDMAEIIYDAMDIDRREGQRDMLLRLAENMDKIYKTNIQRKDDAANGIETDASILPYSFAITEAPVGTGKSYVLLLLSFLSWYIYGKKSVISTQTKVLQNQMSSKDIKMFRSYMTQVANKGLLDDEAVLKWRYRVIKGRGNYICPLKIEEYKQLTNKYGDMLLRSPVDEKSTTVSYTKLVSIALAANKDIDQGDTADDAIMEDNPVYPLVAASYINCIAKETQCPIIAQCPYYKAHRIPADLIITNHAYITNIIRQAEEVPPEETDEEAKQDTIMPDLPEAVEQAHIAPVFAAANYFFDEAHHLMGYSTLTKVINSIEGAEILNTLSKPLPDAAARDTIISFIEIRDRIWNRWEDFIARSAADCDRYAERHRTGQYKPELLAPEPITEFYKALYADINEMKERAGRLPAPYSYRLQESVTELKYIWDKLAVAIKQGYIQAANENFKVTQESLIWTEERQNRKFEQDLHNTMPNAEFVSFTSGTLLLDGKSKVFEIETGIDHISDSFAVESPFRHCHVNIWVPRQGFPAYSKYDFGVQHFKAFKEYCCTYVPPYIETGKNGGVLILCTSVARMKGVAAALAPMVKGMGRHLLVQGTKPRQQLVNEFLYNDSSVLVGTNSFREGFDAQKTKLTWVIMDKLPFATVDKAMKERIEVLYNNGVIQDRQGHTIDLMVFDLIQAFGRLERSGCDWGTITLLDPRFYWLINEGWDDPQNRFKPHMKKPIDNELPYFKNTETMTTKLRWIDRLITPDNWIDCAEECRRSAETEADFM